MKLTAEEKAAIIAAICGSVVLERTGRSGLLEVIDKLVHALAAERAYEKQPWMRINDV